MDKHMTRPEFTAYYKANALPWIAAEHERSGGINVKMRERAWSDLLAAKVEAGELPKHALAKWKLPRAIAIGTWGYTNTKAQGK